MKYSQLFVVGLGLATSLACGQVPTSLSVDNATYEGGRIRLFNSSKTGATTLDWSIWNMTGPYGNGLSFWRYYANGTNEGPALWLGDNGNVGIGTTAPGQRLVVSGINGAPAASGSSADGVARFGSGVTNLALDFGVRGGTGAFAWLQARNQAVYADTYPLSLNPNGGNVGIGTTNPTHKLAVNGTIRAKEVIVDTGWSDYVFADDYRLAPLSEVELHIKAERHLPGIPSAEEVAQHGVNMGEMQSKLLAKIEELTLHAIAQEKRTTLLERENATLRVEIRALENSAKTK